MCGILNPCTTVFFAECNSVLGLNTYLVSLGEAPGPVQKFICRPLDWQLSVVVSLAKGMRCNAWACHSETITGF